jgi:hypothetical protein
MAFCSIGHRPSLPNCRCCSLPPAALVSPFAHFTAFLPVVISSSVFIHFSPNGSSPYLITPATDSVAPTQASTLDAMPTEGTISARQTADVLDSERWSLNRIRPMAEGKIEKVDNERGAKPRWKRLSAARYLPPGRSTTDRPPRGYLC